VRHLTYALALEQEGGDSTPSQRRIASISRPEAACVTELPAEAIGLCHGSRLSPRIVTSLSFTIARPLLADLFSSIQWLSTLDQRLSAVMAQNAAQKL
jgi:hypothetical protein